MGFDRGQPVLRVTTKTTEPPIQERTYDLCPECLMSLHEWLDLGAPKVEEHTDDV